MNEDTQLVMQRLRKGFGAQGFEQAVNLFIRLAEVPLFLTYWGAERYGEWLMISAIPAYLAMADGGFTGTTQREMTIRMGAGDQQGALTAFQSTWVLLLIVSAVALVAATMATVLLPFDQWLGLKSISGVTLIVVVFLLTTHIIVGFQCGLIYGGYSCEGRYARGTILTAVSYLFDFSGLALAVMLGGGPVQAALGFLMGRLIGLLIFLIDMSTVAPWLRFGWANASKVQVVRLFRPSLASMAFPFGEILNIQGMRLVVGIVLGPVAVAVFSSIRTLCRSAMKPIIIVARLIEPEMALAYGAGRHELMRKLLTRSSQITLWAALTVSVVLWFAGASLIELWSRGKIALDVPLYTWLLVASVLNGLWFTALMVPYATNRHIVAALFFSFIQAGALILAVIFTRKFGISGAGLALVAAEAVLMIAILRQAFSLSGETFSRWLRIVVQPPIFLLQAERESRVAKSERK